MKRLLCILMALAAMPVFNSAQKPKYPYNHVFHATVNTVTVYAEAYNGATTADMVNAAITDNVPPDRIVIDSHMSGNSCDFTGITLTSDQTSLVDLRQGKIAWGFKDPASNSIVCQVQSGSTGTSINSLTVTNFNNSGGGANGLISGGAIYYTGTGYNYTVTAAQYSIGGVVYSSPQTNITLAAADPTNPRIDVVYVNNAGAVGVLTGTPAANPSEPSVDPTTQIALGFITVAAASTSPTGTTTENIYLEDAGPPAEWGCTTSGVGWNCADTTHPYQGTKDIQSLGTSASSYVQLTRSAAESVSGNNVLFFALRTESAWHGKWEVWMTFYNGSTPVGNTVFTQNNGFGWNGTNTGTYQLIGIPLSAFSLSSSNVDGLRILWNNGGTSATNGTIYLDQIQLQQNGVGGGGSGGGGSSTGLTNVVGTGDGNFFPATIPSSTTAGVETMNFSPNNAPANTVWSGPLGAPGSNVSFRQSFTCISSGTTANCPVSGIASGDAIVVLPMYIASGSWFFGSVSDTLGTSYNLFTCSGSNCHAVGFAGNSGSGTITISGGSTANGVPILILDLADASAYNDANSHYASGNSGGGVPFGVSSTVTPNAATDAYINVVNTNGTCYGGFQFSPSSTKIVDWTPSGDQSSGAAWISAPGSTGSVTYTGTATTHTGSCHNDFEMFTLDFSQSATASSGPGSYKTLSSLVQSLAPKAVQSTSTFTISAAVNLPSATSTTVLSGSVTMPSSGCPCRAIVESGIFLNSTTSATWGWWLSDGTNTFGWGNSITTDAHTPPVQMSSTSPVSYSNNQAVTFSVIINPGTYAGGNTVQALSTVSPLPAAAKSWLTVTIVPSVN